MEAGREGRMEGGRERGEEAGLLLGKEMEKPVVRKQKKFPNGMSLGKVKV